MVAQQLVVAFAAVVVQLVALPAVAAELLVVVVATVLAFAVASEPVAPFVVAAAVVAFAVAASEPVVPFVVALVAGELVAFVVLLVLDLPCSCSTVVPDLVECQAMMAPFVVAVLVAFVVVPVVA